jgi:hypothetical protein
MGLRLVAALLLASATLAAIVIACTDQTNASFADTSDASSSDGRTTGDAGEGEDEDATTTKDAGANDAKADARAVRDANGPGEAGDDCVFNHDCQLALRCECDNGLCTCEPGARGTGKNGVDTCDAGEDCTSSLCVEGPGDGGVHYCSDECETSADCTGMLPKCTSISFLGKVCVRNGG